MRERDIDAPHTRLLIETFREALSDVPPSTRAAAIDGLIDEALRALSWSHGNMEAAKLAYYYADRLATAGSVRR